MRSTVATAFQAWVCAWAASLRVKNQRLEDRGARAELSLWNKNKSELIELAVRELGMSRDALTKMPLGQIRLELKEAREICAAEPLLPKNMSRMKKSELKQAMTVRMLRPGEMTCEEMKRRLRQWCETCEHLGTREASETEITDYLNSETYKEKMYGKPEAVSSTTPDDFTMVDVTPEKESSRRRQRDPASAAGLPPPVNTWHTMGAGDDEGTWPPTELMEAAVHACRAQQLDLARLCLEVPPAWCPKYGVPKVTAFAIQVIDGVKKLNEGKEMNPEALASHIRS